MTATASTPFSASQPAVSVVMPIYNAEAYLDKSLGSVRAQTLECIEILCVDDGSTDASARILARHAAQDERIRVITKANAGYGAAMNDGIAAARGAYIGCVEPDDYVDSSMFETLYRAAVEKDCDVVKGDFFSFTGEGDGRSFTYCQIAPGKDFYGPVFDATRNCALMYLVMMTWEGIYRTTFLRDHGIVHNESPGASFQDNGFWWQVFSLATRVHLVNEAHYYYRTDNPSSSNQSAEAALRILDEHQFVRAFLETNPTRWNERKTVYSYFLYDNLLARLPFVDPSDRAAFCRSIAHEYRTAQNAGEVDTDLFPTFMAEELEAICAQPDTYDPADWPSIAQRSWDEVASRTQREDILRDSISPYSVVSCYTEAIVER